MAEYSKGSQVLLTDKIRRWIRTQLLTTDLPHETREELRKYTTSRRNVEERRTRTIPFELLKSVHEHVQAEEAGLFLNDLLEGSDIHLPPYETPARNPELEARIQKLKAEQANKEYAQMTRNVDASSRGAKEPTVGSEMKMLNSQLLAVFNFLVTVIGSFVFAYKAVEYSMEKPSLPLQLCSGLVTATVVFFADLYFLMKTTI